MKDTTAIQRDLFRGKISQYREIVRLLLAVVGGNCDDEERDQILKAARAMLAEEIPS